jgi:hypothetical protein
METVHTINLSKREDRLLSIAKQAKQNGFAIKIWEGIEDEKKLIQTNVGNAHKQIVRFAKENNLPYIIICEDDIVFVDYGAFDYYISQMPEDYDLYLGMIYNGEIKNNKILNGFSGLTLYTIHNRFYDYFLSASEGDHLDRWLGNTAYLNKYIVCDKFVCKQSNGYSDRRREKCNYDVYYLDMTFYKYTG